LREWLVLISGETLRRAIISGANNISTQKKMVDELNVFPVPDGDTGTNMSMTIQNAAKELGVCEGTSISEVAQKAASALLRGARGNSGVILSLLFRGFSKGLKDKAEAEGKDIAKALTLGVEAAYKAVMNPTEGTILTVARVAAEKANASAKAGASAQEVWSVVVQEAEASLEKTPELLPVLKKAGVVDAGGKGLCIIFQGMKQVIDGGDMVEWSESAGAGTATVVREIFSGYSEEITFTYCTEFIVNRENGDDPLGLRAFLETIGDCVVVVDDEDIIKVHVHTNHPGKALEEGLKFGTLTSMKIENMREQHTSKIIEEQQVKAFAEYAAVDPAVQYGFVAVAVGAGIHSLFKDLGCNQVVSGGQTMNPSTDDILNAVHSVPAKTVFVLPNNKNIIMAAEQAITLADRTVIVLPTATIPQGLTAMMAFDPGKNELDNQLAMNEAFANVATGQVTFAARDSDFDGHKIKKGEILALVNNRLSFVDTDLDHAVQKLTRSLLTKSSSFVTLFYGRDVSADDAEKVVELLKTKISSDLEVMLVNGGQPVYYYLISVE